MKKIVGLLKLLFSIFKKKKQVDISKAFQPQPVMKEKIKEKQKQGGNWN